MGCRKASLSGGRGTFGGIGQRPTFAKWAEQLSHAPPHGEGPAPRGTGIFGPDPRANPALEAQEPPGEPPPERGGFQGLGGAELP